MSNDKEKKDKESKSPSGFSRRDFLKNTGLALGGIALGGGLVSGAFQKKKTAGPSHNMADMGTPVEFNHALMFFTPEQHKTVEELAETIFPKTDAGPGAKELGVAYYIDHQLAGNWGLNTKEYMSGPFSPSEAVPEQGYQTHLKRQEVFEIGIEQVNSYSLTKFKKKFFELEKEDDKIAILQDFESDKVKLNASITASFFFKLLRGATIEGVYADPMYGGNKDMGGWKMKNFPGHQGSYAAVLGQDKFVAMKPQGLNSQHKH